MINPAIRLCIALALFLSSVPSLAIGAAEDGADGHNDDRRASLVDDFLTNRGHPRMWQDRYDAIVAAFKENPESFVALLDAKLRLPENIHDLYHVQNDRQIPTFHMRRLGRAIEAAKHLGPEHGAQVLREFEAVLRTRIEDQGWVAIVAYKQGVSAEEIKDRKLGVHPALPRLHGAVIDALAELGDTSLVRYVARALAGDARGGSGGRAYLLRAVRAGDAEARRWLEYLLENHPNAFPDARAGGSAAIHEWGRKAREALAAGEAVGRPEGEASSAGSDIDDADDADAGEAGAAP